MNQTNTRSPQKGKPGLPGRFSRDGYFSEPGYLGFSDYERAEYKAACKPSHDRIMGKQIISSGDRSGMGLGESARTEDKKTRSKNATFGVFERLYAEAYKEPNFAEKKWENTVKSKVIGPQWRPSDGGKSRYSGGGASGMGFH